jgi:N-acetylglutamate synthase
VENLLLSRGYRVKDRSRIMLLDLEGFHGLHTSPYVSIHDRPSQRWIEGVCSYQAPEKRNADHLSQIVHRIRVPAGFATINADRIDVGFAMCAIGRGYAEIGSVIVAASHRCRGFGRALTDTLLAHTASEGAHHAFLQVDATNAAAIRLYSRQGFIDVGGYLNMIRP